MNLTKKNITREGTNKIMDFAELGFPWKQQSINNNTKQPT
jgi:hypothetical protein